MWNKELTPLQTFYCDPHLCSRPPPTTLPPLLPLPAVLPLPLPSPDPLAPPETPRRVGGGARAPGIVQGMKVPAEWDGTFLPAVFWLQTDILQQT